MWRTPKYHFKFDEGDGFRPLGYREVIIDVTASALKKPTPGQQLENIFNLISEKYSPAETKVLDLGAGALRNSRFFAEKGYEVYSAEYKDLFKEGSVAKEALDGLIKLPNYHPLIFPKDLFNFQEKVDLILLVNVPTVIPVEIERFCLLLIARKLLSEKGALFWYSDPMMRNKKVSNTRRFIDGYLTGPSKKNIERFYVEILERDIETLITTTGFKIDKEFSKKLKVYSRGSLVYFAQPEKLILLSRALDLQNILKVGTTQKEDYYISTDFRPLLKYLEDELKAIDPGTDNAQRYHRIIAKVLELIFDDLLTDMEIEKASRDGLIRIDILFRVPHKQGFFDDIQIKNAIFCPYLKVECKNYTDDPKNPEYSQLIDRLNPTNGNFGFLVVRHIEDREKTIANCKTRASEAHYQKIIVVLDDSDISELIDAKIENPGEITTILHRKFREIIF